MTSIPSVNLTPWISFGNWLWPSMRRQFFCAPSTSLKTMASAVLFDRQLAGLAHEFLWEHERAPFVRRASPHRKTAATAASVAYLCAAGEVRPSGGQTIRPSASGMRKFVCPRNGSFLTRRWREEDSNHRSRLLATHHIGIASHRLRNPSAYPSPEWKSHPFRDGGTDSSNRSNSRSPDLIQCRIGRYRRFELPDQAAVMLLLHRIVNPQPALSLVSGNRSSCPKPAFP